MSFAKPVNYTCLLQSSSKSFKRYINQIENDLLPMESQLTEIKNFLNHVHYSKILSYILKAKNNPKIKDKTRKLILWIKESFDQLS